jgi:AcrR family transcriptional regulator
MEPAVREQLEETMLRELGEKGREGLSPTEVLGKVGVSAQEFAETYGGTEACLDAAYERLTLRLDAAVRLGCATGGRLTSPGAADWKSRVWAGLESILVELADRPGAARALIRAYPALGPAQQARYQDFIEGLVRQLQTRRAIGGIDGQLPESVDTLAVGAAEAIVFDEITAGRTEQLARMGPSILFSILVPYLGAAEAAAEMERVRQSP